MYWSYRDLPGINSTLRELQKYIVLPDTHSHTHSHFNTLQTPCKGGLLEPTLRYVLRVTDSTSNSRSSSPSLQYPYDSEEDGQYSVMSMDTSISRLPSPCLFPMMIDGDNKTFYLSPLGMAAPLPRRVTPPICSNCPGYVPIHIPSCTPTPQLAIRSTPFPDREAHDWKKAATNLASMIGTTMVECKLPMKQAVSRVLHYVYLTLISEDSQKSEEDDESTLISTSSSTSSFEDPVLPYTIADKEAARTLVSLSKEPPAPPPTPSSYTNEADDEGHPTWTEDLDDSDRPYTPLSEFPDGPTHYLDKEAGRWFINAPEITRVDHHYFPISNDNGHLEDATYLRYEVNAGRYSLLHATHGPNKPTYNCLLRPCPVEVELHNASYTPLQRRLFRHDEPFLNKVEEALNNICDVTLRAGVYSACQHVKQAMLLKDAIGKLDDQLATCIRHTKEAFTDLEQASAFTRINLKIKWSEMEQDDFSPSEATKALDKICGILPQPHHPAPCNPYLPCNAPASHIPLPTQRSVCSALRSSPVQSFGYFRLGPGPELVQYFINQDWTWTGPVWTSPCQLHSIL